jgi:choline dehydrogenase-like flavoprotein
VKRAIVVGTGAGGATVAKELQGEFEVVMLEAGREFRPFTMNLSFLDKLRKTGLFLDEREIPFLFPTMRIRKAGDNMVLVNGRGTGGTTTIATGNAMRMDGDLRAIGIDLDEEFAEISREIPISTEHQKRWHPITRRLYEICQRMGLEPRPTPKMGDYSRCIRCGRCILGCSQGAKWDTRQFVRKAVENGAQLITDCTVEKVVVSDGLAVGVEAKKGWSRELYPADLVILAAGGLGTPVILQNSGVECERRLFVDPVLCVAAPSNRSMYHLEVAMPFVVQRDHYIVSPYFDYLSFFFHRDWRHPIGDMVGLMIKLADTPRGSISKRTLEKELTDADKSRLKQGVEVCRDILREYGAPDEEIFLGTVNAGHPGGMLPLAAGEAASLHHRSLPDNLFVADATLLPDSLGNPPILTIIALAKRISKVCAKLFASHSLN